MENKTEQINKMLLAGHRPAEIKKSLGVSSDKISRQRKFLKLPKFKCGPILIFPDQAKKMLLDGFEPKEVAEKFGMKYQQVIHQRRILGLPKLKHGRKPNSFQKIELRKTVYELSKKLKNFEIAKIIGISRQRVNQILNAEKHRCREHFQSLVRTGKIKRPSKCQGCGKRRKVEGHHADYSKSKDVEFLCKKCHAKKHSKKTCRENSFVRN